MALENVIGILASVFTAVSMIPQLVKIIKEKKAENVSLVMLVVLVAGLGMWIYYGLLKKDLILIGANSFSFILNIVLAFFATWYKKKT